VFAAEQKKLTPSGKEPLRELLAFAANQYAELIISMLRT